jgi:hypothetical protein
LRFCPVPSLLFSRIALLPFAAHGLEPPQLLAAPAGRAFRSPQRERRRAARNP